jgi:hypothetical protein
MLEHEAPAFFRFWHVEPSQYWVVEVRGHAAHADVTGEGGGGGGRDVGTAAQREVESQ